MICSTPQKYQLQWDHSTPWAEPPSLGSVYTQPIKIHAVGDYTFEVSFHVSDSMLTLGCLFCEVKCTDEFRKESVMNYFFGDFITNMGAMKFAQFALEHFIEWENWAVCPSFEPIEWINGDPISVLTGEQIVVNSYQ